MRLSMTMAAVASAGVGSTAFGAYTVTQSNAQNPVAGSSITFDEPGVPFWNGVDPIDPDDPAFDNQQLFYQDSDGIAFGFGDFTFLGIADWDAVYGMAGGNGTGNSILGTFGVRMEFSGDITELDFQGWTDASPPPFGGLGFFLFDDDVQVGGSFDLTPVYGTTDDSWFHAAATGGDKFDEIRFFGGNGFQTIVDNITFTTIPAPGALALFGLAGLAGRRRRH